MNNLIDDEPVDGWITLYSKQRFGDNRLSWIAGVLLIIFMIIGLSMNQVRMTGVLPNGTPITVTSFTEEGAQIELQKRLKKTDYDHFVRVIVQ